MTKHLIINREHSVSMYDGKYVMTREARKILYAAIKDGRAEKIIDTEETLSYHIHETKQG